MNPITAARLPVIFGSLLLLVVLGLPNFVGQYESLLVGILEVPVLIVGSGLALRSTLREDPNLIRYSSAFRAALGVVALIVVGQIAKSKKFYPFMPLRMYGSEAESHETFLVYEARLSDGTLSRFRPSQIIPELGAARAVRGLERRFGDLEARGTYINEETLSADQKQGLAMLRFLMHKKNENITDDTDGSNSLITEVLVYRIELSAPYSSAKHTRSLLFRVPLEAP